MQLHVIIEIIDYIKNQIESKQIFEKYESLLEVIKKISSEPDKDFSTELAENRNAVIMAQNEAEPVNWSYSRYSVLQELDKDCIIGKRAVLVLNSIFDTNQANPTGMAKDVNRIIRNMNKVLNANTGALEILSNFSDRDKRKTGRTLLTLFFEGKTSVNTINDIERYSRIWDNIIRDFAMLTRQDECEPVIDSIDKKLMILQIQDGDKILESLSYGTGKIISTYSKILRIRKIQLEALQMELNHDLIEFLEEEIEITINKTSHDVVMDLMLMNGWNYQNEKDEIFNNVQKSLKLILDFIEKGGKIECSLMTDSVEIAERNKMLLSAYETVKEIEGTVKEIRIFQIIPVALHAVNS